MRHVLLLAGGQGKRFWPRSRRARPKQFMPFDGTRSLLRITSDRLLGVALQRKPEAENPTPEEMYDVGCAARLLKMLKFPDDSMRVLVQGLRRIKVTGYDQDSPYLIARIDVMEEDVETGAIFNVRKASLVR